ncbi:ATP-grasp domain-containing protein [Gimesia algae]|uniref:Carbamoyl phosphate synthase-like protein n=1 Tax=Gimesia algae TaxID=2527971 RepID=A0A517VIU3_9PLAN|nr:ATP-grasp domain-containing protein [Gimesia algae]QDT92926.1 carbamoyl phosphate synthase-like protein [Gimesia algae]
MNIFVTEYLCSGACELTEAESGLLEEGFAMLEAVITDLLALPHSRVMTGLQQTLSLTSPTLEEANRGERLQIFRANTPGEAGENFKAACRMADCVLIIAPEFEDLLFRRTQQAVDCGTTVIGSDLHTIRLTADKWQLYQLMQAHSIPVIPTQLLSEKLPRSMVSLPCLIKHRCGAGGLGLETFETEDDLQKRWNQLRSAEEQFLLQPFLTGRALSTVALIRAGHREFFPVGEQQISWELGFEYQGGIIPVEVDVSALQNIHDLLNRVCDLLPGLAGYVGFDILMPDDAPNEPVLVEINTRLTTSYTGYRRLTHDNLAARIIDTNAEFPHIEWNQGETVRFRTDGSSSLLPQS